MRAHVARGADLHQLRLQADALHNRSPGRMARTGAGDGTLHRQSVDPEGCSRAYAPRRSIPPEVGELGRYGRRPACRLDSLRARPALTPPSPRGRGGQTPAPVWTLSGASRGAAAALLTA